MRMRMMLLAAVVGLAVLGMVGCAAPSKYDVASNLEKGGYYQDAVKTYDEVIKAGEHETLVPYAMYHKARCYRAMGMKDEAMAAYTALIEQHSAAEPAQWAKVEVQRIEAGTEALVPMDAKPPRIIEKEVQQPEPPKEKPKKEPKSKEPKG